MSWLRILAAHECVYLRRGAVKDLALERERVQGTNALQDAPPAPKDDSVVIETTDAFEAYVVSYGGWQSEEKFTSHASELVATLHAEGAPVDTDEYYAVGYDSPFRLLERHNEVWLLKSSGASDADAADVIRDASETA